MSNYDSRPETYKHILKVQEWINHACHNLSRRSSVHDQSKLESPELELFDEWTPKLKEVEYNSPEYKDMLGHLKPALDNHYAKNRHHPEHWAEGINDMSLLDLLEMVCDWKAATERNANGNIMKSLQVNKERYNISDQLYKVLLNTINELGMR